MAVCVMAQPRYQKKQMMLEALNRGVVAIRSGNQVVVCWRTLSSDKPGEAFDVYRNGEKMNVEPMVKGGTFYVDEHPL